MWPAEQVEMHVAADDRLQSPALAAAPSRSLASASLKYRRGDMKTCRLPSALSTRRLIKASRSLEPGGGRRLQNFCHSCSDARSAKDDDGITNGPGVTATIRPSWIEISQAVAPTSSRKLVVR